MTNPSGGIEGVLGRISSIEARFAPTAPADPILTPPPVEDFEPFGEVYERAVAARPLATRATATRLPVVTAGPQLVERTLAGGSAGAAAGPLPARVAAAIDGRAAPPGPRPVGGYGAMPVPGELEAYGNGRIPADALGRVDQPGSNHRLHAPAAASWNNLVADASRAGFELRITDSYRSYDQQVDLAARKGLYSQGGYAAVPGTSNHGWGLAVDADVRDPRLQRWLQENAPRYGWVEAVPREPWHWEFRPHQV